MNRLSPKNFIPSIDPAKFSPLREITEINRVENNNELTISYKVKLRSYAITQLLYITNIIEKILNAITCPPFARTTSSSLFFPSPDCIDWIRKQQVWEIFIIMWPG